MINYSDNNIRAYCDQLGMQFDEEGYEQVLDIINNHVCIKSEHRTATRHVCMTQELHDKLLYLYAFRIKHLFTPNSYTFIDRCKIAMYFLFNMGL